MQIALLMYEQGTEEWVQVGKAPKEKWPQGEEYEIQSGIEYTYKETWKCPQEHTDYDAWMFGRQYGLYSRTQWQASGLERRVLYGCHTYGTPGG
jgi:hypothetical protein